MSVFHCELSSSYLDSEICEARHFLLHFEGSEQPSRPPRPCSRALTRRLPGNIFRSSQMHTHFTCKVIYGANIRTPFHLITVQDLFEYTY